MRWLAIAAVLAGCGGTAPEAQSFEGAWSVQVSGASGQMALTAEGAGGVRGTWSVAGLGAGTVAGTITPDRSLYFALVDASGQIGVDVTATVSRDSMSGVVHDTPRGTFTATRN